MKKGILLIAGLVCFFAVTQATTVTILVSDFTFTPANASAHVGDTIRWVWTNGVHTSTSGVIPAGATPWDAPITSANPTFSYKLTVAGTYNYVCTPHVPGMVGTIAVSPTNVPLVKRLALRVHPNPANENLEVAIPDLNQSASLKLLDMTGKTVFEEVIQPGTQLQIQTSQLPAGVYQMHLLHEDLRQTEQIVIRH